MHKSPHFIFDEIPWLFAASLRLGDGTETVDRSRTRSDAGSVGQCEILLRARENATPTIFLGNIRVHHPRRVLRESGHQVNSPIWRSCWIREHLSSSVAEDNKEAKEKGGRKCVNRIDGKELHHDRMAACGGTMRGCGPCLFYSVCNSLTPWQGVKDAFHSRSHLSYAQR